MPSEEALPFLDYRLVASSAVIASSVFQKVDQIAESTIASLHCDNYPSEGLVGRDVNLEASPITGMVKAAHLACSMHGTVIGFWSAYVLLP